MHPNAGMICAIVPAAGASTRMGVSKQVLPFGETTVIGHVVDEVLQSGLDDVIVVVGRDGDRVTEALGGRPVRIVVNPDPQADMLSSVRCGLRALPQSCAAVLVALGDQPAVTADLIASMIRRFRAYARGIVVPRHGGRRGHPLLFAARYAPEILTGFDDVGLRGLLHAHPDDVCDLEVADPSVLADMDCPEDYLRELARTNARGGSTSCEGNPTPHPGVTEGLPPVVAHPRGPATCPDRPK